MVAILNFGLESVVPTENLATLKYFIPQYFKFLSTSSSSVLQVPQYFKFLSTSSSSVLQVPQCFKFLSTSSSSVLQVPQYFKFLSTSISSVRNYCEHFSLELYFQLWSILDVMLLDYMTSWDTLPWRVLGLGLISQDSPNTVRVTQTSLRAVHGITRHV